MYSKTPEKDIIDSIKKDFNLGAKILVAEYSDFLKNKAFFFGFENEDAEELISDLLFNALNKINEGDFIYEGEGKLKGWLYISLRNKCRDYFERDEKIKNEIVSFSYDESDFEEYEENSKSGNLKEVIKYITSKFEEENIKEDTRKVIIIEALSQLSVSDQFCIKSYLDNKKHKEIGEMLNCTEDAAKKRVKRALNIFCNNIAKKLNINSKEIYEELKQIHKQDNKGRITER